MIERTDRSETVHMIARRVDAEITKISRAAAREILAAYTTQEIEAYVSAGYAARPDDGCQAAAELLVIDEFARGNPEWIDASHDFYLSRWIGGALIDAGYDGDWDGDTETDWEVDEDDPGDEEEVDGIEDEE